MRSFFGNPVIEWLVMVFAMMAGFVAVKLLLGYLPDSGFSGAVKGIGMAA
jgi:hypothetical protein